MMIGSDSRAAGSKDGNATSIESNPQQDNIEPDEEDFECIPCEFGGYVEPRRHPGDPTEAEIAEHNMTHCPFRSWCPVCVEAQGKEDPHYRATKEDILNEAPVISMDYKELSEYSEGRAKVTTVVCRDKWTKSVASHVVKAKGSIECAKKLVEFLDPFGYNDITLKSDNESAIKVLRDEIISKRTRPTRPAGSVPMHPQTHGRAEKAVQDVTDQVRKLKMGFERRLKTSIPIESSIIHWVVEHAALLINRHQVGHDGKTAYRRVNQREAPASQFEFAEQVLARYAPKRTNNKRKVPLAPRSTPGTWVGSNEATAENIVVLHFGRVVRVRIVFRKPEAERWNLEQVLRVKATPMSPNPCNPDQEIIVLKPINENSGKSGKDFPETKATTDTTKRRNFKMTKRLFDEFGFTPGCIGCEAIDEGLLRRIHSKHCRERIAQELNKSEKGRKVLKNASDRLNKSEDKDVIPSHEDGGHDDGVELFAPEEFDESSSSEASEFDTDTIDEAKVLAWINKIAPCGCTPEEVRQLLKHLDETIPIEEVNVKGRTCNIDNDISEVYSPPRIVKRAKMHGLRSGFSMDLTTNNLDGEPWDFNCPEMRRKAIEEFNKHQPEMLIMSPMCGLFSQFQGLNYSRMSPEDVEDKLRRGISHLKFCMSLCRVQSDRKRHFMIEHPANASSWTLATIKEIMKLPNVMVIDFDFCQYNMRSKDAQGEGLVKKRTKVMTNSTRFAKRLMKAQCTQDHRHVPLVNYRAGACQEYTDEFCDEVCQSVKEELLCRKNDDTCAVIQKLLQAIQTKRSDNEVNALLNVDDNPHPHDDIEEYKTLYRDLEFYDDIYGRPLDKELATRARKLEMDFFKKMKAHSKVERSVAKQLGAKVITTRWIDTNKGDESKPDYRARLVGREIKIDDRPDLFAATPPLESLRMILSICAHHQHDDEPYRILSSDIKRAYFFAKAKRPIFIEIQIEDREPGDENKIGRLNLSLYGTRDAAMNWQDEFTGVLVKNGFQRGKASPCNFVNVQRKLCVTVHGDDFTSIGPRKQLYWFQKLLDASYECKHHWLGPDDND